MDRPIMAWLGAWHHVRGRQRQLAPWMGDTFRRNEEDPAVDACMYDARGVDNL